MDVELWCDLSEAARTDNLDATIDYGELARGLQREIRESRCLLIEALAERLLSLCLSYEKVRSARVTVHKPGALGGGACPAVRMRRERIDGAD